jgi:hypothetical protein
MLGMDGTIPGERLDLTAQTHAETDRVGGITDADFFFKPRWQVQQADGPVKHKIHTFTETWFVCYAHDYPLMNCLNSSLLAMFTMPEFAKGARELSRPSRIVAYFLIKMKTFVKALKLSALRHTRLAYF